MADINPNSVFYKQDEVLARMMSITSLNDIAVSVTDPVSGEPINITYGQLLMISAAGSSTRALHDAIEGLCPALVGASLDDVVSEISTVIKRRSICKPTISNL